MDTQTVVEQQPMTVSQSTFGTQIVAPEPAPAEVSETQVNDTGNIIQATEQTTTETQELPEDVSSFVMTDFGQATPQNTETSTEQQNTQQSSDWKTIIKNIDKKELFKELGYDEFVAEFADFRANGGDPYAYLEAKSFDWNKVSDADLLVNDLSAMYPNLSQEELHELFADTYKQGDFYTEDENRRGLIKLKADAYNKRQQKIENQKKFQIPQYNNQQSAANKQLEEEYQRLEQEQQARYEQTKKFIDEHEATKRLMESKRVTIPLADGVNFSFNADPNVLQSVAFGNNWARAIAVNPQEADESKLIPDVAKIQRLSMMALNPNYEKDIFNFGKSQGRKELISEGQNAQRPIGHTPNVGKQSITDVIKNGGVKISTFGG